MSRDLAAEHAADEARRELESLRELRARVLEVNELLRRANSHEPVPDGARDVFMLAFDSDGCGPFLTLAPSTFAQLTRLARGAR